MTHLAVTCYIFPLLLFVNVYLHMRNSELFIHWMYTWEKVVPS